MSGDDVDGHSALARFAPPVPPHRSRPRPTPPAPPGSPARANLWRIEGTIGAIVLVLATVALTAWPGPAPARTVPAGLTLVHSGLAMADPFETRVPNRQLQDHYVFNGSAAPGVGWVEATSHGLDVGVRPTRVGRDGSP